MQASDMVDEPPEIVRTRSNLGNRRSSRPGHSALYRAQSRSPFIRQVLATALRSLLVHLAILCQFI